MLRKIKTKIFRALSALRSQWFRLRGICVGRGCVFTGKIIFRCRRGSSVVLENGVTLHGNPRYNELIRLPMEIVTKCPGARIELKENCGLSGCKILCANKVSIGRYTIVGPDTIIYDCKEHEYTPERGWLGHNVSGSPVIIGDYCYIGMRCIILKGVTIGDHCVISAGTLINRNVPAGHLAQGNPAVYTPLPRRLGGAGE